MKKASFGLNGLTLKIIAAILMTLDHIALLFISRTSATIPLDYYILRAIGKMAFPIYAYLAVEGAYKTHDIIKYLLRLGIIAIVLDGIGFIFGGATNLSVNNNPLVGNAFMDMFMGVLLVTLLRKKNIYSLFALLPLSYEILSDVTIDVNWGTLFKSDWGTYSIILFLLLFLAREGTTFFLKDKAKRNGLEENAFLLENEFKYQKIVSAMAIIINALLFYLIYRLDNYAFVLPNEFVPIGTYSCLAFIFILFYNGKKGYSSKAIQYSFYAYYPLHLLILGIFSFFFGVLANL